MLGTGEARARAGTRSGSEAWAGFEAGAGAGAGAKARTGTGAGSEARAGAGARDEAGTGTKAKAAGEELMLVCRSGRTGRGWVKWIRLFTRSSTIPPAALVADVAAVVESNVTAVSAARGVSLDVYNVLVWHY